MTIWLRTFRTRSSFYRRSRVATRNWPLAAKVDGDEQRADYGCSAQAPGRLRNKHLALLNGLLYCECCAARMVYSYAAKGGRKYPYYVCRNAQVKGWDACPSKSLPAQAIEESVPGRIRQAQGGIAGIEFREDLLDSVIEEIAEFLAIGLTWPPWTPRARPSVRPWRRALAPTRKAYFTKWTPASSVRAARFAGGAWT